MRLPSFLTHATKKQCPESCSLIVTEKPDNVAMFSGPFINPDCNFLGQQIPAAWDGRNNFCSIFVLKFVLGQTKVKHCMLGHGVFALIYTNLALTTMAGQV